MELITLNDDTDHMYTEISEMIKALRQGGFHVPQEDSFSDDAGGGCMILDTFDYHDALREQCEEHDLIAI